MRDVVIKAGVYGRRDEKGRVLPVAKGEFVTLSDEEAARLVALDVAVYADAPTQAPCALPAEAPCAPPVLLPGSDTEPGAPQDTPGDMSPAEIPGEGDEGDGDSTEVKRLERMPKDDLVQMAQDLGVDISGAKNNHERAVLIVAAGTPDDGDTPPALSTGDIVQ
jgi:hypothetical protein